MIRSLALSLALAAAAVAPAASRISLAGERELRNDRFKDTFWDIEYSAPGLAKLLVETPEEFVFAGRCDGGVEISIRVLESEQPADAARAREEWLANEKPQALEKGDTPHPWVMFVRKHLEVYDRHHGILWVARGYHCFVIRATVFERTDRSGEAIMAALRGLRVGKRDEGALLARRVAWEHGLETGDPQALLEAGSDYVTGRRYRRLHPVLARRLLGRARASMKSDTFEPGDLWRLYEMGGTAWFSEPKRDLAIAMDWFAAAEKAAAKLEEGRAERAAGSAYNLACAAALLGRTDDAFAALDRAYREVKPVTDSHISDDKDLDNLRRDPRWEGFWRTRVKENG